MKNLILSLLGLLIINLTLAQGNGGQVPENSNIKLEYLGGGKVKVTNKQIITGNFQIEDAAHDSILILAPGTTGIFFIDPSLLTNIKVRGKALTNCGGDCGWVELFLSSLPLKFLNFGTERISDTEFYVNFEIAEVVNVKDIYIKVSLDGKVYKVFRTLKPNQTKYHEKIDLKEFVKTGKTPAEAKQ